MSDPISLAMPRIMLDVRDVLQSVTWYESVGFELVRTNRHWNPDAPINWALLRWDDAQLMLNERDGAAPSCPSVSLFFDTDGIDALYQRLVERVDIAYGPIDQFYGQRELAIRDPDEFVLIFAQPLSAEQSSTGL